MSPLVNCMLLTARLNNKLHWHADGTGNKDFALFSIDTTAQWLGFSSARWGFIDRVLVSTLV